MEALAGISVGFMYWLTVLCKEASPTHQAQAHTKKYGRLPGDLYGIAIHLLLKFVRKGYVLFILVLQPIIILKCRCIVASSILLCIISLFCRIADGNWFLSYVHSYTN